MPSNRGGRPIKHDVLAFIAKHGPCTVATVAAGTGLDRYNCRVRIEKLVEFGDIERVVDSSPVLYVDAGSPLASDPHPFMRRIRPAGTWRLDHPTSPNSVFEMGVMA